MTPSRSLRLLLVCALALVAGVLATALPQGSSATFTASSGATAAVRAAADWTPPSVAVTAPGSVAQGVVTVAATASDEESGIARVTLERLTPGGDWVALCTAVAAPYSCSWDTRSLADGPHSLRARAVDGAGLETTSDVVRTTVANKLLVTLADPGAAVRGTVPLTVAVHNVGTLQHTVRVEYAASGSTAWKTICTGLAKPYACSWNTGTLAAGDYDLRAVLVAGGTSTPSAVVEAVAVDNTAPVVSLADPGSPLSGSRTFTATATDAHTDVERVVIQYAATGGTTWHDLCSVTDEPWSCRVATSTLADGSYGFRAVATDSAGNTATSTVVANRLVDNTVASVAVEVPARLSGTVKVGATASSTAGVASVAIQVAATGTGAWRTLCTDTAAPWSCTWDTTTVPDGLHDLRAVMVDTLGRSLASAVETGHRVDNAPLRGADVQTANGGATAGRAESGDTVTFTYGGQVDLATVLPGWDGRARAVTVRLRDGGSLFLGTKDDTLDVLTTGGSPVALGSVNLRGDYVRNGRTALFASTMTATEVTGPDGMPRTVVTLRLGSLAFGGLTAPKTVNTANTMEWTPAAAVTDLLGRPCSTTTVHETGARDREF